jgi:hypothetical protein
MKYLKISNIGLLDIRLVYLMGGTTKANDQYKIGQFGTGLKYSMAYMLRNNIDFKIFIDGMEIKLGIITENIRDTDFNIITINGEKTSITTNMGLDWSAWMIIRELWCNALDEVGGEYSIVDAITPSEGTTEYYIELTTEIINVYNNWSKYFIHGLIPIMEGDGFSIYSGGDALKIYKQGVLIHEEKVKSVFNYDIADADLNELREARYSPSYYVMRCIPKFDRKTVEIFLENLKGKYEDETLDYTWFNNADFGEGWAQAIGAGKFCEYELYQRLVGKYPNLETQPIVQVSKGLFKRLIKQFPTISLVRASDKLNEFYETYSDSLHDRTQKCIKILEGVGYYIDPNLKILYGVFGNKSIWAQVSLDDKEIRISENMENKSDFDLIKCLIEENEHFKTGFEDLSREFQTHFLELYCGLLLKSVGVLF